jgi:hypothetical protein
MQNNRWFSVMRKPGYFEKDIPRFWEIRPTKGNLRSIHSKWQSLGTIQRSKQKIREPAATILRLPLAKHPKTKGAIRPAIY